MATKADEILNTTGATVTEPTTPTTPAEPDTGTVPTPPVETPPAEEPPEDGTTADDLQLFLDDEDDILDADEPPVEPSSGEPGTEVPPAGTPAEAPPAGTPPGEPTTPPAETPPETLPAVAQPPTEPTATPPEPSPQPMVQPLTPEEARAQYDRWHDTAIEELAGHYAFTEDEVAEYELDAGMAKALPALGARMYVDAVVTSVHRVMEALPQAMDVLLERRQQGSVHETAFFDAWPQLAEHKDTVMRFGSSYRNLYPGVTPEQFIQEVGAQVMVSLKLQPGVATPPADVGVQTPAKTPPFAPAAVTRPAPPGKASTPSNPYEALDVEMFDVDDMDLDNR